MVKFPSMLVTIFCLALCCTTDVDLLYSIVYKNILGRNLLLLTERPLPTGTPIFYCQQARSRFLEFDRITSVFDITEIIKRYTNFFIVNTQLIFYQALA